MTIPPIVATIVGTLLMILTTALSVLGGILPPGVTVLLTSVIAVLTWVSTHVLHKKAVAAALKR
jgi:hypothetical protein